MNIEKMFYDDWKRIMRIGCKSIKAFYTLTSSKNPFSILKAIKDGISAIIDCTKF